MVDNAFDLSTRLSIYLVPTENVDDPSENADSGDKMVALIYESDPEILLERYGTQITFRPTGNLLGHLMLTTTFALPSAPYPSDQPSSTCLSAWILAAK